jgi:hypothetical protein
MFRPKWPSLSVLVSLLHFIHVEMLSVAWKSRTEGNSSTATAETTQAEEDRMPCHT